MSALRQILGCCQNLALHILLLSLYLQDCTIIIETLNNEPTLVQVLLNLVSSNVQVRHVVLLAERAKVWDRLAESGLHLKHIEQCLTADLCCMRPEQDVLTGLDLHLVSKSDGLLKVKVLKESLCELSEAVWVGILLTEDHWEGNLLQSIILKDWHMHFGFEVLNLWLVCASAKEECGNHVSHEVLASQLDHILVGVSKVGPISEEGGKHSVGGLWGKTVDKRPVEQIGSLVEHSHWALSVSALKHVFELADGGEFSALSWLVENDHTSQ